MEKEEVRISNLFQANLQSHFQNVNEGNCNEDNIFAMTEGKHNDDAADHVGRKEVGGELALI